MRRRGQQQKQKQQRQQQRQKQQRKRGGADADGYIPAPTPNPHRLGSKEWYLEERRRDGKVVATDEDRARRKQEQRSVRQALSDADVDREELPDLAAVSKRKANEKDDDHPPVWALCGLLFGCVLWMVVLEVVTHWWTVRGSFSFHVNALRRHLEV